MMALDPLDVLDTWPLPGWRAFTAACALRDITEFNLTGTNTDPLLYQHHLSLRRTLGDLVTVGIRTNGVLAKERADAFGLYDKASITVCSLKPEINQAMMGGPPPDVRWIREKWPLMPLKANILLGPENRRVDLYWTVDCLADLGFETINLREPYGQPHVGNPFGTEDSIYIGELYGMPQYAWGETTVTYWDVHWVEVESVNLYANGRVSVDYPITRGHSPDGEVWSQDHFPGGRVQEQWRENYGD
jgi:hypothetical protein